jgi:hypothetical protein
MRVWFLPLVSGVALGAVLVLAIINFPMLTGAGPLLSYSLTGLLPVFAVLGVVAASRLKRRDPRAFAQLGSSKL